MGKLKDRVTTTISADLIPWHRVTENEFIGMIHSSITRDYDEGQKVRFTFIDVKYYPKLNAHWEDHFIGKTKDELYIRMEIKHQLRAQHRD